MLEKAGKIANIERQVKYILIPEQRENPTIITKVHKGEVKLGRIIERECSYYADFVYTDLETNEKVVEDSKGFRTKDFLIKKKLMLYVHGIKLLLT